ncbi:MAG: 3-deoxy-D-manno-octulosonic acid transferase [Bacteroidota bacterium]
MMRILYDISIQVYIFLVRLASLRNRKARLWIRGRRSWYPALTRAIGREEEVVWFHCSSLGEFEQGRPLMEKVRKEYPGYRILLTFFSPSGYEKRKTWAGADYVAYLPADTLFNAWRFVSALNLKAVFFIKYEFWFHFLHELHRKRVPVYLVSGIFRDRQIFFRKYGRWYRGFLRFFTHFFVQNERSAQLLESVGITAVTVSGDTRFDRVLEIVGSAGRFAEIAAFAEGKTVLVAGSTWEPDEQLIQEAYRHFGDRVGWIIAPHEVTAERINRISRSFPGAVRFSDLLSGRESAAGIIIVDTIGHLSALYRYARIAYIGGGFGRGIHNVLEAAAYGLPVIFGPRYDKFQEAVDLVDRNSAFPVENAENLILTIERLLSENELLISAGKSSETYVKSRAGATEQIVDFAFKNPS